MSKKNKGYDISKLWDAFNVSDIDFKVSKGNSKLGNIPSFNLLPIVSCSEQCMKEHACGVAGCYAVKNALHFGYSIDKNNVLRAWGQNTKLVTRDIKRFEKEMDDYLTKFEAKCKKQGKPAFFRIHSGGDFINVPYARAWKRLIDNHPSVNFLAFTKQWNIVRRAGLELKDNFSLIPSGWTGMEIPKDFQEKFYCSYCVEKGQEPPKNAKPCPGNCETCNACWMLKDMKKHIWFAKH